MRTVEQINVHKAQLKQAHKFSDDILGKNTVTNVCKYKPKRLMNEKQRNAVLDEIVLELGLNLEVE